MISFDTIVIFGGTGFIGTHLTQHFLKTSSPRKIVLVDLLPPRQASYARVLQEGLASGVVTYVQGDVRKPLPAGLLPTQVDCIFNLAAVHREPGHAPHEYFATNLYGAENICAYATAIDCNRVVFTSSISPYGASEEPKDETSLPLPETPYGSSKLVAEKMHLAWRTAKPGRNLLILRPGVVFGPGEGGNVTRLVRSLAKGYFAYMGNRETRKAGGYVKELARVAHFALDYQATTGNESLLINFSTNPTPTIEDFVKAIKRVLGTQRASLSVPRSVLLGISYPIDAIARTLGIKQPISPVRIRKLFRSTSVNPTMLLQLGYVWHYTLDAAFEDWKQDNPEDFAR
jgi:nucleoside-diphosphate-sugar epimerase